MSRVARFRVAENAPKNRVSDSKGRLRSNAEGARQRPRAETREGGADDGDAGQRHLALSRGGGDRARRACATPRAAPRFREEKTEQNASATADFSAA